VIDGLLRPLSSFSASFRVASDSFSHGAARGIAVTIGMRVPAQYVIGTARTGFGCLNEYEYIVLGNIPGEISIRAVGVVV